LQFFFFFKYGMIKQQIYKNVLDRFNVLKTVRYILSNCIMYFLFLEINIKILAKISFLSNVRLEDTQNTMHQRLKSYLLIIIVRIINIYNIS